MKYDKIDGLDKKISKLIMGNDNQTYFDEAVKLWDNWVEVGGNAFDTAYIYGGGSSAQRPATRWCSPGEPRLYSGSPGERWFYSGERVVLFRRAGFSFGERWFSG